VDPNPNSKKKVGIGYGYGSRHCSRRNNFVKKIAHQTLEWEKTYRYVFLLKLFLWRTKHIRKQWETPFIKISGQNISPKIRIRIGQKKLWIRIQIQKNEFGSTTLSQSYGPYCTGIHRCKPRFSRSGGFCCDSATNSVAYRAMTAAKCQGCTTVARTARVAKNGPQTFGSSRKKTRWQVVQRCPTLAYRGCHSAKCNRIMPRCCGSEVIFDPNADPNFLQVSDPNPTKKNLDPCGSGSTTLLCPIWLSWGIESRVVAKSSKSGEPVFISMYVVLLGLSL
jgi:hypothetical protein